MTRKHVMTQAAVLGIGVEVRHLERRQVEVILAAPHGHCFGDIHERVLAGYPGEPLGALWEAAEEFLRDVPLEVCPASCEWCYE